jgi:hypothetical protein
MAGDKRRAPHWEQIVKDKLGDIIKHPDFNDDWGLLHASASYSNTLLTTNLRRFMQKYDAPKFLITYLKQGILFGDFEPSNVPAPIFIVSEIDGQVLPSDNPKAEMEAYAMALNLRKGRVLLDLTADTQRKDIDDFLNLYFDRLIKPKLKLLDPERMGANKTLKRDEAYYKVVRLYKEKTKDPKNRRGIYRQIEAETELSPMDVKKFIARYRVQMKYNLLPPQNWEE